MKEDPQFKEGQADCFKESVKRSFEHTGRPPSRIIVSRGLMDMACAGLTWGPLPESPKLDAWKHAFKTQYPKNTGVLYGRPVLIVKDTRIWCITIDDTGE